jgi:hypothetical protein
LNFLVKLLGGAQSRYDFSTCQQLVWGEEGSRGTGEEGKRGIGGKGEWVKGKGKA